MSDLYSVLGVNRDASTEDIRRAYKDLARVKHPDRGGNPEEFKAIQEAHEVLCDDERRKMYNITGSVQEQQQGGGGGFAAGGIPFHFMNGMGPFGMPGVQFDMGNIFGNLFGQGGPMGGGGGGGGKPRPRQGRGPNKHHDVGLRLCDFYKGHEIKLKFNQARRCTVCAGSGAESSETCAPCHGSGSKTVVRQIGPGMIAQTRGPCDACGGEGTRATKTCRGCQGKRFIEREKQLDIKIAVGMREGEQMAFVGECSDSMEFETPGDVILRLQRTDAGIKDEDEYDWKQDDLWIRKRITYSESVLGFTLNMTDHPSGSSPVLTWRGGPLLHGAVLTMLNLGMPRKTGGYGNLYIQILVTAPELKPWSTSEAAILQSVLGGTATSFADHGSPLLIHSAESLLSIDKDLCYSTL